MLYTPSRVHCSSLRKKRLEREFDRFLILVPGIKYVEPYVNFAILLDITWCLTFPLLSRQLRVSRIISRRLSWAAQVNWIRSKDIKYLI